METKRNCYDVLDEVISPDNVMNIGELIALKTVQRLVLIKAPRSLCANITENALSTYAQIRKRVKP